MSEFSELSRAIINLKTKIAGSNNSEVFSELLGAAIMYEAFLQAGDSAAVKTQQLRCVAQQFQALKIIDISIQHVARSVAPDMLANLQSALQQISSITAKQRPICERELQSLNDSLPEKL